MTISEALKQIKEQDSETAFRYIYDVSYERIFRTAYYYVKEDESAREIAIDVLASLWNRRKTMIIPTDFMAYCFIATKNMALNHLRKTKLDQHEEIDEASASHDNTPEQKIIDEELFAQYERALYALPERCREIFTMIKEDGMTYAQVAEQLDISPKTVDAQIQKATKQIRSAIEKYMDNASNGLKTYMMMIL